MKKALVLLLVAALAVVGLAIAQTTADQEDPVTLDSLMLRIVCLEAQVGDLANDIDDVADDAEDILDLCEEIFDLLDP